MTKSRHSLKAGEDGENGEKKTNKTSVRRSHCLPCPVSQRSLCPFMQQMGDTERERKDEKQEMKTGGKIYIRTPLLGFSIIATATGYLATGYTMVR